MKTPKSVLVIGVAGCLSSALCSTALTPTAAAADTTLSLLQQSSTDAVAIMAQNSGTAPIFTSPTALVLSAQKGQTAVGTLNLKKSSTDQHSYYLSTNQGWVWMNPPYGSTQTITTETDQLVITAQTANLPTGTHSAVVYIVDSGPNNFTNMLRIPVTLTVTATAVTPPPPPPAAVPPAIIPTPSPVAVPPPPAPTPVVAPVVTGTAITSSPAALALSAVKGQTAVGTLSLRKGGTDQHSYYLSTNQGWVWMNPPYGSTQTITTETDQLVITAQTANLPTGTHSAVVYIDDSGPSTAWPTENSAESAISMVTPRLVSSTRTLPCCTSGASAAMMSWAMLFIRSRCNCLAFSCGAFGFAAGAVFAGGIGICGVMAWLDTLIGTLRKALVSESERTRYLPSLIDDSAYMTTKNANSSVMKSA